MNIKLTAFWDETHNNWTVIRLHGKYSQHAHFSNRKGAGIFMKLTEEGILATAPYFASCQQRILTEGEFKSLRKVA